MDLLAGKTALVTGAARRLGRAIVRALSDAGAGVVIHYGGSAAEASSLRGEILRRGAKAWIVQGNLSEDETVVEKARAEAGRPLNILVNNASVFRQGGIDALTWDELSATLRVNAWAPFALSRAFVRQTKDGVIVNMIDSMDAQANVDRAAYALSKMALADLTRMSALAFAPSVRVNGVAPGPILPPPGQGRAYLDRLGRDLPLRRAGDARDIVDAVLFLVTTRYMTGEILHVDGGRHIL